MKFISAKDCLQGDESIPSAEARRREGTFSPQYALTLPHIPWEDDHRGLPLPRLTSDHAYSRCLVCVEELDQCPEVRVCHQGWLSHQTCFSGATTGGHSDYGIFLTDLCIWPGQVPTLLFRLCPVKCHWHFFLCFFSKLK